MTIRRVNLLITDRARTLRSNMTDVERLLWQSLRGKQINGYRFRRQHPIGKYIADFACVEQRLVVELDGSQHQNQLAYDEQRSLYLQEQGWRVLRFWNNDMLENFEGVLFVIAEHLEVAPPP
ncbi:MAG: endonuclease domain-containing protein [Gallionella sp.]